MLSKPADANCGHGSHGDCTVMLFARLSGSPLHPACLLESKSGHLLGSNSAHLYLVDDHLEELGLSDHLALEVSAINDEYDGIGASVISRPDATNTLLTSEIPCA